ncbi:DMT family transporter [Rummeliibacillus pycnus]|uniref:DMT family transporter n=1 Tax=Rummeliibacillus pycnus TaxID=101070 RepID=UPI003D2D0615
MKKHWFIVLLAVLFEILWVIGLKHSHSIWAWSGTAIAVVFTFYLLLLAGRFLPVGTVYTVFTGLGTAGTILVGVLFFGESLSIAKILLLAILLVGVIGLKTVTSHEAKDGAA